MKKMLNPFSFLKLNLSLIILFLSHPSFSSVYCFESHVNMASVKSHLSVILTGKDDAWVRGRSQCLEVKVSSDREELVYKWLVRKYKVSQPTLAATRKESPVVTKNCRLQVEKISKGQSTQNDLSVGKKNSFQQNQLNNQSVSRSAMLLGQGYSGSLSLNGANVYLTCEKAGSSGYTIRVALNSAESSINTVVYVSKGQKLNVGTVVDDLNRKSQRMGLPEGIEKNKVAGQSLTEYFLLAQ